MMPLSCVLTYPTKKPRNYFHMVGSKQPINNPSTCPSVIAAHHLNFNKKYGEEMWRSEMRILDRGLRWLKTAGMSLC